MCYLRQEIYHLGIIELLSTRGKSKYPFLIFKISKSSSSGRYYKKLSPYNRSRKEGTIILKFSTVYIATLRSSPRFDFAEDGLRIRLRPILITQSWYSLAANFAPEYSLLGILTEILRVCTSPLHIRYSFSHQSLRGGEILNCKKQHRIPLAVCAVTIYSFVIFEKIGRSTGRQVIQFKGLVVCRVYSPTSLGFTILRLG